MMTVLLTYWLAQSVLTFGITFAFFQGEWPQFAWRERRHDAVFAFALSVLPFALPVVFCLSHFAQHGLRFRAITRHDSWRAYQQRYPGLTEAQFARNGGS